MRAYLTVICALLIGTIGARASTMVIDDLDDGTLTSPNAIWRCTSFKLQPSTEQVKSGSCSLKVMYDKKGEKDTWGFIEVEPDLHDFSSHELMSVWVYGQVELLVKLWNTKDRQQDVATLKADNPTGWTQLVFDYSNSRLINKKDVQRILIFPAPGKTDCSGTFYIDSIELIDAKPTQQEEDK